MAGGAGELLEMDRRDAFVLGHRRAKLAAEQLCVCHFVELTGATSSNISNHLAVLRRVGAVVGEPAGRFTYYRLRPEALETVSAHYARLASRDRLALAVKRPCD